MTFGRLGLVTICLSLLMVSKPVAATAGPDYPWSCRDADAVMASARKFSDKTPLLDWDQSRILHARKEYAQCFGESADGEDRFRAGQGTVYATESIAYREFVYAKGTNILRTTPVSKRRAFFDAMRGRAIRDYTIAARLARTALRLARDEQVDTGDFDAWVQHHISDRLSEMNALSFSRLQTYAQLTASSKNAPKKTPVKAPQAARVQPSRSPCARPNVAATSIHVAEPDTPPLSQLQGISGTVQVVVSLDAQSQIVGTRIQSSPSAILNQAALAAARQSTFQTEIRDCTPIAADYIFAVEFSSQ